MARRLTTARRRRTRLIKRKTRKVRSLKRTTRRTTRRRKVVAPMGSGELIRKHDRLVKGVVRTYLRKHPMAEFDDLLQEGRMGLLRAGQLFQKRRKGKKRASFSTYAYPHITKRVREAARASHLIHVPERKAIKGIGTSMLRGKEGMEALLGIESSGGIPQAHARASLSRLFKKLPDLETKVLKLRHLNGQLSYRDIAKRLSKSVSSIHGLERRAFARLRGESMVKRRRRKVRKAA